MFNVCVNGGMRLIQNKYILKCFKWLTDQESNAIYICCPFTLYRSKSLPLYKRQELSVSQKVALKKCLEKYQVVYSIDIFFSFCD